MNLKINENDTVEYCGYIANRHSVKDVEWCRHVFIGDTFVVKIDNPRAFDDASGLGTQCLTELQTYEHLKSLEMNDFVPELIEFGKVLYDGEEVNFVVQERVIGRHTTYDEAQIFKKEIVERHGLALNDAHFNNVLRDEQGKMWLVDLGMEMLHEETAHAKTA